MHTVRRVAPLNKKAYDLAKAVKNDPEGVIIQFLTSNYSSKDAAKKAGRSFQIAFAAMRSRERERSLKIAKAKGYVDESEFFGPFDHLGAFLREEEYGWEVRLLPEPADPMVIIYASTGEPVREFTPEGRRWKTLVHKITTALNRAENANQEFVNPLTDEEVTFMWNYDGTEYRQMWLELTGEEPEGAPQKETAEAGE